MQPPLTLLCGMSRSGTTWLGKIFDSHPDTLYRHEPDSVQRIEGLPIVAETSSAESYRERLESYVERLCDLRHPKAAASLPVFPKSYFSKWHYGLARATAMAVKGAERVVHSVSLPALIDFRQVSQLHLVWKSIELVAAMAVVLKIMPTARGILILRHPCGYVASVARGESKGKFDAEVACADDFGVFDLLLDTSAAKFRGLSRECLRKADPYERLAWRWVLFNEKAVEDLQGSSNSTQVLYEDLCSNPIMEAKRLFQFSGLHWSHQVEDFICESGASDESGYYSIFKDPRKAANKWREELTPAQIDAVMGVVAQSTVGRYYLSPT